MSISPFISCCSVYISSEISKPSNIIKYLTISPGFKAYVHTHTHTPTFCRQQDYCSEKLISIHLIVVQKKKKKKSL